MTTQWEVLDFMEKNKIKETTTKDLAIRMGCNNVGLICRKLVKLARTRYLKMENIKPNKAEYKFTLI